MKQIVTADDIRALADQGERELLLHEHTLLTDAAVDAAHPHGVRLVEGGASSGSAGTAPPSGGDVVAALPVTPGGLPAPALAGLVRERSRPAAAAAPPAAAPRPRPKPWSRACRTRPRCRRGF